MDGYTEARVGRVAGGEVVQTFMEEHFAFSNTMNTSKERETPGAPERTCAGCRRVLTTECLERFVLMDGQLVHDLRRKAPGRGAWVEPNLECLRKALAGGLARSFKGRVEAPRADALAAQIQEGITRRLRENLQVALRARQLAVGAEACAEAMRSDQAHLVLIAPDAGAATRQKYRANADRKQLPVREDLPGSILGSWLGREFVAVAGVTSPQRAGVIARDAEHLDALGGMKG